MHTASHWTLLETGKFDQGIEKILTSYPSTPTPSEIMELGVAYLWAGKFHRASVHFNEAAEKYSPSTSSFFAMAGTSNWCLNDFSGAVRLWERGLRADFQDTAGLGVKLPLLLFICSVLQPHYFDRDKATSMLADRSKDSRISTWPGPVALWLVNPRLPNDYLTSLKTDEPLPHRDWLARFYSLIRKSNADGRTARKDFLHLTANIRLTFPDEDSFLSILWYEEFFIARRQGERGSGSVLI
jgi:hypothetical protein